MGMILSETENVPSVLGTIVHRASFKTCPYFDPPLPATWQLVYCDHINRIRIEEFTNGFVVVALGHSKHHNPVDAQQEMKRSISKILNERC